VTWIHFVPIISKNNY